MKKLQDTVIQSDKDVYELWQGLMGSGGFSRRSLWLLFLDVSGRLGRAIMPIDDIPICPDARLIASLMSIVADLKSDGHVDSVAMLLSRPGPHHMTPDDRLWARALREPEMFRRWPMHLATADRMQVFAADDLVA